MKVLNNYTSHAHWFLRVAIEIKWLIYYSMNLTQIAINYFDPN